MRAVIVKEYIRLSKLPCAAHKYSRILVSAAYTRGPRPVIVKVAAKTMLLDQTPPPLLIKTLI